tara:strand:- start:2182 stop:2742 length:561 start_codon:yes stop_codon:yes gene_type:complete
MFDTLLFEAELPKEKLPEQVKEIDLTEAEFQTTDLSKSMDTWSVSSAGKLFLHECTSSFVEDTSHPMGGYIKEIPEGIKHMEETKSIHFYKVFEGNDETDYWVSFDALFRKGNLLSVDLCQVEEVPAEARKEAQEKAKEMAENVMKTSKTYKRLKLIAKPLKYLLGILLIGLAFVGRNMGKLHSKL